MWEKVFIVAEARLPLQVCSTYVIDQSVKGVIISAFYLMIFYK